MISRKFDAALEECVERIASGERLQSTVVEVGTAAGLSEDELFELEAAVEDAVVESALDWFNDDGLVRS